MTALRSAMLLPLALLGSCGPQPRPDRPGPERIPHLEALAPAAPREVGMHTDLVAGLDSLLGAAVAEGVAPGFAVAVGRHGRLVHVAGYGRLDPAEDAPPVDPGSTIYDLASLTKVVATTTAAMILEEEGRLDLDRPVREYLPELTDPAKAAITPRMLLLHRAGLEAFAPLYREVRGSAAYLERINERPLRWEPATRTEYSDWDFVLLQLVVERITGESLADFTRARIFAPLGMNDTGFNPDAALRARVAPTEVQEWRGGKVHGEVHDENAWAMGGVAGHAGLFSTARDLAVFAQMMLDGGTHAGTRILSPQAIARWTARQEAGSSRALGWDTPSRGSSAGRYFSPRSFGHTGFTGTSIWIDPRRELFVVLLSNRVNPTRENQGIGAVRRAVADLVQTSVLDAPLLDWESRR